MLHNGSLLSSVVSWTTWTTWTGVMTLLAGLVALPAAGQAAPDDPHKNPIRIQNLHAGPISIKFQDGELRYLTVGDKEVVRRIYFAVRDGNWNTAMPKFTHYEVKAHPDNFTISLEAQCQSSAADYHWTGQIVGKSDGTLTFTAKGAPNKDFPSNRIGICVLWGAGSLIGQKFQTRDAAGVNKPNEYPALVSPTLVAEKFQTLSYTTASGLEVVANMQGATFDMEDQRNWGDTSFKAYAPLPYAYPGPVKQGDAKEQVLTLTVRHAPANLQTAPTDIHVTLGKALSDRHVPEITTAAEGVAEYNFAELNQFRDKQEKEKIRTWGINPSVHLPDEDTMTENLPTVAMQAATAREFAPGAPIHIIPVRIRGLYPDGKRDVRNASPFGAAWSAAVLKYMALGGVDHADFDMGPGLATFIQADFKQYSGKPVVETTITGPNRPTPVEAFAVQDSGGPVLWLINLTSKPQTVTCDGLTQPTYKLFHFNNASKPTLTPHGALHTTGGQATVTLTPYQVVKIQCSVSQHTIEVSFQKAP